MSTAAPADAGLIVIGGSAGALQSVGPLLRAAEALTAAALVVVHIPAGRPAMLVEVLSTWTDRSVFEAQDKQPIEERAVYVCPPDYHLLADSGPRLALSIDEPVNYSRPAIDVLFQSAADLMGSRLLAILLSGASADGAAGMAAVVALGGLAWIQQPGEAPYATMPLAAIAAAPQAAVLGVAEMCRLLAGGAA